MFPVEAIIYTFATNFHSAEKLLVIALGKQRKKGCPENVDFLEFEKKLKQAWVSCAKLRPAWASYQLAFV